VPIAWLPALLLAAYALAFVLAALGGGLLVVDDHPGQLYRLAHAIALGPWPWRLDPGWWAGYAELQYYPPGFSYAGAALSALSFGALGVEQIYRALLVAVYVLPGVTTYALLARVLRNPWLALPGAFVALTLSAGSRSGVEEGVRWGMVAARLGVALLPCLALALRSGRATVAPAVLLAAIIITHPAHAPAAVALVLLRAWFGPEARASRVAWAGWIVLAGVGLASFWLVPLLAHLEMALPLAWGDARLTALAAQVVTRPLVVVLALGAAAACWMAWRTPIAGDDRRWLAAFTPAVAALLLADALVVEPLGIRWLPADRLLDGFLLALIVGASLALGEVQRRRPALPAWALGIVAVGVSVALAPVGRSEPTLTLWPRHRATEWTTDASLTAGARLDALWSILREGPAGRVLFVRSSVPLGYRPEWWRPHSHIPALAPIRAGRDIVNGTFTHPSPIAGLVYTGSAAHAPITRLVEQRDGVTLFGRPLDALGAREFQGLADRLRVSAVVALDEDAGRLDFVKDNPEWNGPSRVGPFLVWRASSPRPLPPREGVQRWRIPVGSDAPDWVSTGFAYSPLWRAASGPIHLDLRRDSVGLLEVKRPPSLPASIVLAHEPGVAEQAGLVLSAVTTIALAGRAWARRRRRVPFDAGAPRLRRADRS